MLKLLLTLTMSMALAVTLLQVRQQRLELNYQTNQLHNQVRAEQSRLWSQQLQIAQYTAPNAISKTVGDQKLKMVPQTPMRSGGMHWIDPNSNPDAE